MIVTHLDEQTATHAVVADGSGPLYSMCGMQASPENKGWRLPPDGGLPSCRVCRDAMLEQGLESSSLTGDCYMTAINHIPQRVDAETLRALTQQ